MVKIRSRITIEQAKGVLSQALDLSIEDAFDVMCAYALAGRPRDRNVATIAAC